MNIAKTSSFAFALLGGVLLASGQTRTSYNIYALGNPLASVDQAKRVAEGMGLALSGDPEQRVLITQDGVTRGHFTPGRRTNTFNLAPNLDKVTGVAPVAKSAINFAKTFLKNQSLMPTMTMVPQVAFWGNSTGRRQTDGTTKQTTPVDRLATVNFVPSLDGLPVYGPHTKLSCTIGVGGVVHGLNDTLRSISLVREGLPLISTDETDRMAEEEAMKAFGPDVRFKMVNRRLIYSEQGREFIQPTYEYFYESESTEGTKTGQRFLIPAVHDAPEADCMEYGGPNLSQPIETRKPIPAVNPGGVYKIGLFVVRNDHECWLEDAWDFWTQTSAYDWLGIFTPKTLNQFYWDHAWCWDNNNSKYYPGANNFTVIEGHGAPWLITCLSNNADVIHIKNIPGLGANQSAGEINNWVEWHSCDVIPAPIDGFGGDFQSGSCWDVWWHMFRGMKGNLGYRTTMAICDEVSATFGYQIGLGMPVVSSWINSTAAETSLHNQGWDYGSAVYVTGRGNDSMYSTAQLPNATSLTMWWIH